MGEKQTKILRGKHEETTNKYLPVNSNLFVLYYFCLVLVFEARILRALWTMISEDKENMWTSNLIKKSNNDNSAVVVAFASNNNIKQYQTQFKYKISVLHSLLWVSNTQKFIHYKKFWKLKSSISERISVCLKEVLFIAPLMLFLWKKKSKRIFLNGANIFIYCIWQGGQTGFYLVALGTVNTKTVICLIFFVPGSRQI